MRLSPAPVVFLACLACAACGAESTTPAQDGVCQELSRTRLSVEEADLQGYAASQAIAALLEGRTGTGQRLWIMAPPEMWTAHGAEPPAGLATEGQLSLEVVRVEDIQRRETKDTGWNDFGLCPSGLFISLEVTLTASDGEGVLVTKGTIELDRDRELGNVKAKLTVPGWPLSDCELAPSGTDQDALQCHTAPLWAQESCLDPSQRSALDTGLEAPAQDLLAAANLKSPLTLTCDDGRAISLDFELSAPAEYCPLPGVTRGGVAQALARLDAEELSLTRERGYASFISGSCRDGYLPCSTVARVTTLIPKQTGILLGQFSFDEDDAGAITLHTSVEARSPDFDELGTEYGLPCAADVTLE